MGFFDSDVEYGGAYDLPTDYKSGLADVLKEAKKLYEAKKTTGFQDFPGARIAGFTPEERAAMTGIAGLVGSGASYFDPATTLAKGLGDKFTTDTAQEYMNPYQQAVTDVAKRKAREDFEQTMQGIGRKAVGAGSFGGSRQGVVESEAISDLGQRLSDIQTLGSQQAFQDARKAFEAQKARERLSGSALASLGQQAPQQALKELTALSGVGEAGRGMEQSKLDLAYQNFMDRQRFADDALAGYQSTLYGYPYQPFAKQTQGFSQPSSFQNLMGIVGAGAKLFGGFKEGGHVAFRSGGGLSGLTAEYEDGTKDETVGSFSNMKKDLSAQLLGMMNLGGMSSDLVKLQKLRTQIAEAKAKKEAEKDTFIGRLGEFAQGVAAGYDPTKPQTMAGSLAAGASAVQERDPEMAKAQAEAEGLEGSLKTKQVMAELTKDYLKAIKDLSSDIEDAEFNNIEDAVYKSFGFTVGSDGKLQGIGGKAITEEQQLKILKKQADAIKIFKSKGYSGLANFLAQGEVKPKDPKKDGTIINNPKINKFVQPNKV
jgi:virulence-associated protein VapD